MCTPSKPLFFSINSYFMHCNVVKVIFLIIFFQHRHKNEEGEILSPLAPVGRMLMLALACTPIHRPKPVQGEAKCQGRAAEF